MAAGPLLAGAAMAAEAAASSVAARTAAALAPASRALLSAASTPAPVSPEAAFSPVPIPRIRGSFRAGFTASPAAPNTPTAIAAAMGTEAITATATGAITTAIPTARHTGSASIRACVTPARNTWITTLADFGRSSSLSSYCSAELLGESDQEPFRPADVAEPVRVSILHDFAYELRAALAEPVKRLVDVVYGEHDAKVPQSVHGGVTVIRDGRRREEAGELEPAVAVRRAHDGNLDALIAQSRDTSGPFSFDRPPPFEIEAELAKEIDRPSEVIDDDSYRLIDQRYVR